MMYGRGGLKSNTLSNQRDRPTRRQPTKPHCETQAAAREEEKLKNPSAAEGDEDEDEEGEVEENEDLSSGEEEQVS